MEITIKTKANKEKFVEAFNKVADANKVNVSFKNNEVIVKYKNNK